MEKIEGSANEVIPFSLTDDLDGIDGIAFDYDKMMECILRLYGLWEIAMDTTKPPVQFSFTLDGADISRNRSFVAAGLKVNDYRALDPTTGIPIGLQDSTKIQSRELCYLMKIIMSRDTKSLYDEAFKDFFDYFKKIENEGFGPIPPGRFLFSSPQDMSSLWKALKKGGACKQKTHFCHCCSCKSEDAWNPRPERCSRCITTGRERCYHHDVGDVTTMERVLEEWKVLTDTYPYLGNKDLEKQLNCRLAPNEANRSGEPSNIDFVPMTMRDRMKFSQEYINHDLSLLGLPLNGNLEERRIRLKAVLEHYSRVRRYEEDMLAGDYAGAHIMIEQAIPCILHLENRCGEKMIKLLLIEGIQGCNNDKAKEDELLKTFETIVNEAVLGEEWRPANWRLKTTKGQDNRQAIADQTMPNPQCRKMLRAFDKLVPLCVPEGSRRLEWNRAVATWLRLMEVARQHEDFTDEQIDDFDVLCDDFFAEWMDLHGRDGLTNYFHLVGAGHLSYYIRKWRNLYRYSQQGWEGLNSTIKWYYFKRTQRGGYGGKHGEKNSKMKPIARWLQRKVYFLSGKYKELFD